jgi:DNA modification methylase
MIQIDEILKGYKTAESRWARFGPYYAMFPLDFAFNVIEKYSKEDDFIIDPFAGRGSSIYVGGVLGRHSLGIEINPVGWLYGSVKLNPADKREVYDRLLEIYYKRNYYKKAIDRMPVFYKMCYCDEVLKFLLAVRKYLDWRKNNVDATLMSVILVYLHGKLGEGLSNQMKMTKALGMNYSIEWWKRNKLETPPEINPIEFLMKKIDWRYQKGKPDVYDSKILFGDSTIELGKVVERAKATDIKFSLLITSPPYCSVTDYYADQWLRLWLLGGPVIPKATQEKHKGRFISREDYYNLLDSVFYNCTFLMANKSTIYVRSDKREFTFNIILNVLQKYFPRHKTEIIDRPFNKKTQTEICGNTTSNTGEVDIVLTK